MTNAGARLMLVGDLILEEPDARRFFEPSASLLRSADLLVGNVEIPHTKRGVTQDVSVPARPGDPSHLEALAWAGFHVGSLAANHVFDLGQPGIEDTRAALIENGIAPVGAGMNIEEARRPAVVESAGLRWGVLAYNCVGPALSWASETKAGCAYIRLPGQPGRAPEDSSVTTYIAQRNGSPDPEDLEAMQADIAALRREVDVVVVAFHKGVVHVPALVLPYERTVAHAAVDAGADVVAAHHAHILRGIEVYKGKPIFHGLGNFVTVTRALNPDHQDDPGRLEWANNRLQLFGFAPDPAMPTYPFHPESRHTMIGIVDVDRSGALRTGFVPCWIDESARPVPGSPVDGGAETVSYVRSITSQAGFDTYFSAADDGIVRFGSNAGVPH